MTITKIKLAHIKGDLTLQGREELHPELIKEYAETVDELPPIDLYVESTSDGDVFYIGNGWHRFMAHERAGRTEIKAHVHLGGREAALLHACRANTAAEHGRTRSNADKHKAIRLYMTHSDWYRHGNNRIGEACKVDPKTVQEIRLKLQALKLIPEVTERQGKDGKVQSATKNRLSISTPAESSQRITDAYDQAEARAQVGKSTPEKEASSSFASSFEEKKQEDPLSAPPQKPSPQEVAETKVQASEELEEEGSYQHHNTPSWVRDLFEPMGGIALDPCSNQWSIMQARKAFTIDDDGLAQDWLEASEGGLIFINPPYKNIGPWVAKMEQEAKRGAEGAMLVPTSHGTQWWQKAARCCSVMALFNSRVAFTKEGKKNGTPQWETLMFYWGERGEAFCRAMERVALLAMPANTKGIFIDAELFEPPSKVFLSKFDITIFKIVLGESSSSAPLENPVPPEAARLHAVLDSLQALYEGWDVCLEFTGEEDTNDWAHIKRSFENDEIKPLETPECEKPLSSKSLRTYSLYYPGAKLPMGLVHIWKLDKEKSPKKKRGQKETEVFCLSCQNKTPLASTRDLNGHYICAACFAKFPPSLMVTIKASIKEGHAEIQRFGFALTRTEQACEVTPTEATALSADRRLCIELDEMIRKPGSPLYETPDYFLALLRDAKDEDAIKNAQDLADAYLPTEVAQEHAETLRKAASDRREILRKKEEKASAPKRARAQ